jgi:hypothetical protein
LNKTLDVHSLPGLGSFVEIRGRRWLAESVEESDRLSIVVLSCIDDDAQGDELRAVWEAEVDARLLDDDPWGYLARDGADDAEVFAAFLRTIKWRTASAADRDLFQSPFRAGIRIDAYQLAPLSKALRLPRVNLLIADDVGLGKTIEAGLVLRELLLRRRIDFVLVAAPPSMTLQWQDELEAKFGLTLQIIDRERLADLRRLRGFAVNPWATGSRFIVSHRLLTDETYVAGLRDHLGEFRARAHSNSFSALLEILDPQRFTRGVPVEPAERDQIMVRRLKADLRQLEERFPERVVEPIVVDGLPPHAPELDLAQRLSAYEDLRDRRIARLPDRQKAQARLVFSGLQQRLLSSVAAFAKTLGVHRRTLERLIYEAEQAKEATATTAQAFARAEVEQEDPELPLDEDEADAQQEADDAAAAEQASILGTMGASADALRKELAAVDEMLAIAERAKTRPDARFGG